MVPPQKKALILEFACDHCHCWHPPYVARVGVKVAANDLSLCILGIFFIAIVVAESSGWLDAITFKPRHHLWIVGFSTENMPAGRIQFRRQPDQLTIFAASQHHMLMCRKRLLNRADELGDVASDQFIYTTTLSLP